jgi:hypothetical protein
MTWLKSKLPALSTWFLFGVGAALLPFLLLFGVTCLRDGESKAWNAVTTALEHGDLLLIVAAILADSIGRLFHDLLTVRPPTLLQLKLWFALFLALGAGTCSIEFVVASGQQTPQVSSTDRASTPNGGSAVENNLTSDAARANWMPGRVMKSSEVFFCFALVMGLFVILIVD